MCDVGRQYLFVAEDEQFRRNAREAIPAGRRRNAGSVGSCANESCATGASAGSTVLVLCDVAEFFSKSIANRLSCDALALAIGAVIVAAGLRAQRGVPRMHSRACELPAMVVLLAGREASRTAPESQLRPR
jgi:hypothetical protein